MNPVEAKSIIIKYRDGDTVRIELEFIENNQERTITFSMPLDKLLVGIIATASDPQSWLQSLIDAHKRLGLYLFRESTRTVQRYLLDAPPESLKAEKFRRLCHLGVQYLVNWKKDLLNLKEEMSI